MSLIDPKSLKTNRFEVQNKASDKVEILMYGPIGDYYEGISAKSFAEELKKLPDSVKEIHLRINSPGGSVFDGNTIYERLKSHKAKIIVYVDGLAASIASLIAMAGDEIHVGDGSFIMIHKPWTVAIGNNLEMDRTSDLLMKLESSMVTIYSKKTGLSRTEIENKLQDDYWMTADESLDMGFATKKTEASETLHIAASLLKDSKWLKNKPTIDASNSIVKNKVNDLMERISKMTKK